MKAISMISLLMAASVSLTAAPIAAGELTAETSTSQPQQQGKRWQHRAKQAGMPHDGASQYRKQNRHGAERHTLRQLALSDAQKQQLQAMRQEQRAQYGDRAEQRQQRQQLQQLVQADSFDATAARLLLEQHQQQQLERQLAMLEFRHQFWQQLTPEQREQWQQQRSERQPRQLAKIQLF
ncbi:Spy/CpxP family protein refolding chaperone [Alkalimonas sp.]|uniref:Spy/CpxP family protein refolding chaperone n=1 Tax=Alkalimonas sp. TaxID=1872453 RepID=UPI00263A4A8E|nr:Spy/CpxP family protein refolding chaperone [Alkalimonas sp.]MCC5825180.1 Spy/CpxP family protein refolding chaperone [Alkalimonas sp.]